MFRLTESSSGQSWFNDWPDDDSMSKHVATFIIDNKLVVLTELIPE